MDYRELHLLWAARETGVLEAVTTKVGTVEEVAAEAGVTERSARITLSVLEDRGFLKRVGGQYEITNRALGFIAKADVRSIGSVPHQLDCLDRTLALPETMRTGEPAPRPDEWTVNEMGAMAATDEATVRAAVTAAVHERPNADRVLDVGGGPGRFAKEFARRGFNVTVFDRPDVIEVDCRFLEHEAIDLVAGNFLDGLPTGFDLVFCSRVAHELGPAANRRLLGHIRDALEPDGVVVLVDYVRGRSEFAPTVAAAMLALTTDGDAYTESQFGDWFESAGFERPRVEDIPGTELQSIAAGRSIQ